MKNIVGTLMFLLGAATAHYELKPTHTPSDLLKKTALLTIFYTDPQDPDNHNYGGRCAGVWIGQNHILTANHCAWDERSFSSTDDETKAINTTLSAIYYDTPEHYSSSGFLGELKKVSYSPECDLLILRVLSPAPYHPVATFRLRELTPGEEVQTVGHPGELSWAYSRGYVSVTDEFFLTDRNFNVVNINIGHGNSGGGLFDSDNNLVGIARAIIETGDTRLTMFSKQECIESLLSVTLEAEAKDKREW